MGYIGPLGLTLRPLVRYIIKCNGCQTAKRTEQKYPTHRLRRETSCHTLSGSMPALSFSWATINTPRSWYVVYSVSSIIMTKYVSSVKSITQFISEVISAYRGDTCSRNLYQKLAPNRTQGPNYINILR